MPIKLDANGNIDTAALEGDLRSALAADTEYRRTDNMKKRAVRVAKSYDEFKNMVACANLTPVSREDMESLGAVKRGWKKQAATMSKGPGTSSSSSSAASSANSGDALASSLLAGEADPSVAAAASAAAEALRPDVRVARTSRVTAVDFLKHWKRISSRQERFEYLENLGVASTCAIFKKTCEVDVLEQVLQVVMECARCHSLTSHGSEAGIDTDASAIAAAAVASGTHHSQLEWVTALMDLPSFGFNVNFLDTSLRARIKQMLQNSGAEESKCNIFSA